MSKQPADVIEDLHTNTKEPKQYSYDEHVQYFSKSIAPSTADSGACFVMRLKTACGTQALTPALKAKVSRVLGDYVEYLVNPDNSATSTVQHDARLMTAVAKCINENAALYADPLQALFCELMKRRLFQPPSNTTQTTLQCSIQWFYQFAKMVHKNKGYFQTFSKQDTTQRALSTQVIVALFRDLANLSAAPQAIANAILGLGYLAQQGKTYDISPQTINTLLGKLTASDANPTAQHIANTFLGLGYLAQQGKTHVISAQTINALLEKLTASDANNPTTQEIANTFLALGYLAQRGEITRNDTIIQQKLLAPLTNLFLQSAQRNAQQVQDYAQVISSHYRLKHFAGYGYLSANSLSSLETALAVHQPTPNNLQKCFMVRLQQNLPQEDDVAVELEKLVCGYFVDILVSVGKQKIIIELDGQHHQVEHKQKIIDASRDELLRKAGYIVIRLENTIARKMLNSITALLEMLNNITALPGAILALRKKDSQPPVKSPQKTPQPKPTGEEDPPITVPAPREEPNPAVSGDASSPTCSRALGSTDAGGTPPLGRE